MSASFPDKVFDIYPVEQEEGYWCWAACSKMVLDAYNPYGSYSQLEIANWAVGGINAPLDLFGAPEGQRGVDDILSHFEDISTNPTEKPDGSDLGNISREDIKYEIDGPSYDYGRPILANILVNPAESDPYLHIVMIKGYKDDYNGEVERVVYNDPTDKVWGGHQEDSYAEFVQEGYNWFWMETLRMTTSPDQPINTGVGPSHYVVINSGTMEISESTTNLSYHGVKSGDSPDSWEWKLVFPKADGDEVVVESWTTNNTSSNVTWNISNFSLPSYNWHYSSEGTIRGRVQVSVEDPIFHYDDKMVEYIPQDQYPGIVKYHDKTIQNSQPDVKAHELISVYNDLFTSGADIDFRSGDRISIKDGVTIEPGSNVSFTVDGSLR